MSDFKMFKVTRSTELTDAKGVVTPVLMHTVFAGGDNAGEAIDEAKLVMKPELETHWDVRELTDMEYAEYYSKVDKEKYETIIGRLHR